MLCFIPHKAILEKQLEDWWMDEYFFALLQVNIYIFWFYFDCNALRDAVSMSHNNMISMMYAVIMSGIKSNIQNIQSDCGWN